MSMLHNLFMSFGQMSLQTGRRCGRVLGFIWYLVDRHHREIVRRNLKIAFKNEKSDIEIKLLTKDTFKNIAQIPFEVGWFMRLSKKKYSQYFYVSGWENYHNAMKKGRGVLILTGHLGNWELLSVITALSSYEVSIVFRPIDTKMVNDFFVKTRTRFGAGVISSRNAVREILKSLHKGHCVSMLMDQSTGYDKGIFVDLFGCPTLTHKGMAIMSRRNNSPVIPAFLVRNQYGFVIEFGSEISGAEISDKTNDIASQTQEYNRAIESIVRRYPAQWFWVHRRWKRPPYCLLPRQSKEIMGNQWENLLEHSVREDISPENLHVQIQLHRRGLLHKDD